MIDFKDMRPSWEIGRNFHSRDDLSLLGCSDRLANWLMPHTNPSGMIVEPEEWFWRDRDWYDPKDRAILAEMHEICGGTFCSMALKDQCAFLGIPLEKIAGTKAKGSRGKWEGKAGPTDVEDFALEYFTKKGATGFAFEGAGYGAWLYPMNDFYRAMFKKIPGFDKTETGHNKSLPGQEHADNFLAALRMARDKLNPLLEARPDRYNRLWSPLTKNEIERFTDLIGWEMVEKLHDLQFRLGAMVQYGWPDITLKLNGNLRFVEVKSKDRLRGNQAKWVRDVARPLGLKVSVLQVVE